MAKKTESEITKILAGLGRDIDDGSNPEGFVDKDEVSFDSLYWLDTLGYVEVTNTHDERGVYYLTGKGMDAARRAYHNLVSK